MQIKEEEAPDTATHTQVKVEVEEGPKVDTSRVTIDKEADYLQDQELVGKVWAYPMDRDHRGSEPHSMGFVSFAAHAFT